MVNELVVNKLVDNELMVLVLFFGILILHEFHD